MYSGTTDCHIITCVPPAMQLTAQAVLGNRPGVRSGGEKGDEGLGKVGHRVLEKGWGEMECTLGANKGGSRE